jgi:hypothetical protein
MFLVGSSCYDPIRGSLTSGVGIAAFLDFLAWPYEKFCLRFICSRNSSFASASRLLWLFPCPLHRVLEGPPLIQLTPLHKPPTGRNTKAFFLGADAEFLKSQPRS